MTILQWVDDTHLQIGQSRFQVGMEFAAPLTPGHLRLLKTRELIDSLVSIVDHLAPQRVLEIGIYRGGSTAFLDCLAPLVKLVALDIRDGCATLDQWIVENDAQDRVYPRYSVDQSDAKLLTRILDEEFGESQLDLVLDDASHLLEQTRASFNATFPRLRVGGVFVIEDWSFGGELEWMIATGQIEVTEAQVTEHADAEPETHLSELVLELVLATAACRIISEIRIRPHWVEVVRGPEPLLPNFDIRDYVIGGGKQLLPASVVPSRDVP